MSKKRNGLIGWVRGVSVRSKLFFAAGVVLLIVVGVAAWLFFGGQSSQDEKSTSIVGSTNGDQRWSNYKNRLERGAELRKLASGALASGDTQTVASIYDDAVDDEQSIPDKIELRLDQAKLLYSKGLHDEAIRVAKDAEGLSDDKYQVADYLSRVFERRKDYDQAARYYTLAGTWVQSPTNQLGFTKQYYDSKAARAQDLAEASS